MTSCDHTKGEVSRIDAQRTPDKASLPLPSTVAAPQRTPVHFELTGNLVARAQQVRDARAKCASFFPKEVFRDSAWDMMLELFIMQEQGRATCVKELTSVSGETATGTIRRIDRLEEVRLIRRRSDPRDHRRVLIDLTESGRDAMIALLRHLYDSATPAAAPQPSASPKPVSFFPQRPSAGDGA